MMELTDISENINTLLYYEQHGFLPKTFFPLEDIDDNDNTFISVMQLNMNCRHVLTDTWITTSWRIC